MTAYRIAAVAAVTMTVALVAGALSPRLAAAGQEGSSIQQQTATLAASNYQVWWYSRFPSQTATLAGTARNEAKIPYVEYTVRARELETLQISWSTHLNTEGNFVLAALSRARFLVELVNKDGRVVCTEGPYDMRQEVLKNDVVIDCGSLPAAWWLLSAGSLGGITAGVEITDASPAR